MGASSCHEGRAALSRSREKSGLAEPEGWCYGPIVTKVAQIREAASRLSAPDKAELAVFLLGSLEDTHYWVDDEEVMKRREELDSGEVKGLSPAAFREACGR